MSTPPAFFRGTLADANICAAGRRDLTILHDPAGVYPHVWCVVRGLSAWADLWSACEDMKAAKEATKLARLAYCFSSATRRAMKRDAKKRAEWAIASALRAQLHIKAGILS